MSFKNTTKGGVTNMGVNTPQNIMNILTTKDVMKILKIGNKACLELFHRKDFPCMKIGRAFGITEENFVEYFKTRRVEDDERGN